MLKYNKMTIISWLVVIIWMALIFFLSSQVAGDSNKLSSGITEFIVRILERVIPNADIDMGGFNYIVRKSAHFFAYLVLGVLVANALRISGVYGRRNVNLALIICMLYAISDEIHQMFVPGRGPGVTDVLIDGAGSSIGIGFFLLTDKVIANTKIKRKIRGTN